MCKVDVKDRSSISGFPDESVNLSLSFKDRDKFFLRIPPGDNVNIGDTTSVKLFECHTHKGEIRFFLWVCTD